MLNKSNKNLAASLVMGVAGLMSDRGILRSLCFLGSALYMTAFIMSLNEVEKEFEIKVGNEPSKNEKSVNDEKPEIIENDGKQPKPIGYDKESQVSNIRNDSTNSSSIDDTIFNIHKRQS